MCGVRVHAHLCVCVCVCVCVACGTWQFSLHNGEPCGFSTFLHVSVATHVTACGVHVITMEVSHLV